MWFVRDVYGTLLIVLVWCILLASDLIVTRYVLYVWYPSRTAIIIPLEGLGYRFFWLYNAVVLLCAVTHCRAVITDPGTMRNIHVPAQFEKPKYCKICDRRWKPPRAHHCKTCKSCIFRMDHHCPWINNCVGVYTQKIFVLFLIYVACLSAMTSLVTGLNCVSIMRHIRMKAVDMWEISFCTTLFILSSFFCFFSLDFLKEQIESIESNTTLIETHQRSCGEQGTFMENMQQVFGPPSWRWLLPVTPQIAPNFAERVTWLVDLADQVTNDEDQEDDIGIAGEDEEYFSPTSPNQRKNVDGLRRRTSVKRGA